MEWVARIVEAVVVLAVGATVTVQFRAAGERHQIQERLKHTPTEKEVTDEIVETRHQLRGEIQQAVGEVEALVREHHPIRPNSD